MNRTSVIHRRWVHYPPPPGSFVIIPFMHAKDDIVSYEAALFHPSFVFYHSATSSFFFVITLEMIPITRMLMFLIFKTKH